MLQAIAAEMAGIRDEGDMSKARGSVSWESRVYSEAGRIINQFEDAFEVGEQWAAGVRKRDPRRRRACMG